jgi:hypothetical protein
MNVSRREAVKTGIFAALAGFLLPNLQPYIDELAAMEEPVAISLQPVIANQLAYSTRRAYLADAVMQIYNSSPLITGLMSED